MRDIIEELWNVVLKTIWLAIAVAGIIGALRLCAWADTDMKGDGTKVESL
jgi:hypothetical protein